MDGTGIRKYEGERDQVPSGYPLLLADPLPSLCFPESREIDSPILQELLFSSRRRKTTFSGPEIMKFLRICRKRGSRYASPKNPVNIWAGRLKSKKFY